MAMGESTDAATAAEEENYKLCLWEPDPELMIRRAKGQERARKSEHAAEERKGNREENEAFQTQELEDFEASFAVELRAARDTRDEVMYLDDGADPKVKAQLDWWHEQLIALHEQLSGAVHFLPSNTREKFGKSIAELEAKLREERERLKPKKKFGFKNKTKVRKGDAAPPPAAAAEVAEAGAARVAAAEVAATTAAAAGGAITASRSDTFAAPAGCQGFRGRADATLRREAAEEAAADFALQDLERCNVQLLSTSRALWIRNLKGCHVFAVPVSGSIYVTECEDCVLHLGSRQLRIHTSSRVDFYAHVNSHPIIEQCEALRFAPACDKAKMPVDLLAPYEAAFADAALHADSDQWSHVDDFNWLKDTQSPNWSVLPEEERQPPKDEASSSTSSEGQQGEVAVPLE